MRRVLQLRFFDGLTQSEIARDIGVTQLQVSRVLSRIFAELREGMRTTLARIKAEVEADTRADAGA